MIMPYIHYCLSSCHCIVDRNGCSITIASPLFPRLLTESGDISVAILLHLPYVNKQMLFFFLVPELPLPTFVSNFYHQSIFWLIPALVVNHE
jgi:hypothetical protein